MLLSDYVFCGKKNQGSLKIKRLVVFNNFNDISKD